MSKRSCDTCLFGDSCVAQQRRIEFKNGHSIKIISPRGCEHYYPLDDGECLNIEQYIEDGRREFLFEWWSYIEDRGE